MTRFEDFGGIHMTRDEAAEISRATLLAGCAAGAVAGLAWLAMAGLVKSSGEPMFLVVAAVAYGALGGGFTGGLAGLLAAMRGWSRPLALRLAVLAPFGVALVLLLPVLLRPTSG